LSLLQSTSRFASPVGGRLNQSSIFLQSSKSLSTGYVLAGRDDELSTFYRFNHDHSSLLLSVLVSLGSNQPDFAHYASQFQLSLSSLNSTVFQSRDLSQALESSHGLLSLESKDISSGQELLFSLLIRGGFALGVHCLLIYKFDPAILTSLESQRSYEPISLKSSPLLHRVLGG